MKDERLNGVITCGGKATEGDVQQILRFKSFLLTKAEAVKVFGLSERDAAKYAAMEHYGDVNCEGTGLSKEDSNG